MYAKLFASIVHSTIWRAPDHVRLVWITMLALADREGFVFASVPGLADAARVDVDACREALAHLQAPDPDSSSQECEGRRIEPTRGGWRLINFAYYRDLPDADVRREETRERVRRWREKNPEKAAEQSRRATTKHRQSVTPVTRGNPSYLDTEVEVGSESTTEGSKIPSSEGASNASVRQHLSLVPGEAAADDGVKGLPAIRHEQGRNAVDVLTGRLLTVMGEVVQGTRRRIDREQREELAIDLVFSYWAARHNHERTWPDDKRRARIRARLRENNGDVSELLWTIDGALHDDFLMGKTERSSKKYDGVEQILRDRGQVERLAELCKGYREGRQHKLLDKYAEALGIARQAAPPEAAHG